MAAAVELPPAVPTVEGVSVDQEYIFRSKLPDIDIPNHLPLTHYCFEKIAQFVDKPCLIQSTGPNYSYSQVELYSRRIAAGLAELGIGKGDVVMLLLPNCVEFVLLFLGIARIGAAATTCNPVYTPREISKQVNGSRAKLVITQINFADKLNEVAGLAHHGFKVMITDGEEHPSRLHFSRLMEADERTCPNVEISPDDVVALPYSSGTTGLPKGVMLTHKNLVTSVAQQVDGENPNIDFTPDDVVLCVLPMFHIYSLNTVLLCSLRAGCAVAVMTKFEISGLLDVIQRHKVTVAPLVPPIVLALAKNPIVEKYDLSSIRMLMSGAAPLGKELEEAFRARVPHAIIGQGYGMTEAGPVLAMCLGFAKCPFPVKAGACGTVVRNAEVKIIDPETGVSLKHNEPGEICIRGAQIMKGYVGDPEATANTIDANGFLHTGDVGVIDDDDEVFIVDRVKEIIKYKGFQVPPAELEGILLSHPAIADAACVPKKDEVAGEVPVAFVVKAQDADISESAIREYVAKQVVFYKKLHGVYFVESIPKSPAGKILRKELRFRLFAQDH